MSPLNPLKIKAPRNPRLQTWPAPLPLRRVGRPRGDGAYGEHCGGGTSGPRQVDSLQSWTGVVSVTERVQLVGGNSCATKGLEDFGKALGFLEGFFWDVSAILFGVDVLLVGSGSKDCGFCMTNDERHPKTRYLMDFGLLLWLSCSYCLVEITRGVSPHFPHIARPKISLVPCYGLFPNKCWAELTPLGTWILLQERGPFHAIRQC